MSALSSRDALAKELHALGGCKRCQWAHENQWPCKSADRYLDDADRLLASGAVIDVATLADDEALVERVAEGVFLAVYGVGPAVIGPAARMHASFNLRALAAAISERGEQHG